MEHGSPGRAYIDHHNFKGGFRTKRAPRGYRTAKNGAWIKKKAKQEESAPASPRQSALDRLLAFASTATVPERIHVFGTDVCDIAGWENMTTEVLERMADRAGRMAQQEAQP